MCACQSLVRNVCMPELVRNVCIPELVRNVCMPELSVQCVHARVSAHACQS